MHVRVHVCMWAWLYSHQMWELQEKPPASSETWLLWWRWTNPPFPSGQDIRKFSDWLMLQYLLTHIPDSPQLPPALHTLHPLWEKMGFISAICTRNAEPQGHVHHLEEVAYYLTILFQIRKKSCHWLLLKQLSLSLSYQIIIFVIIKDYTNKLHTSL